MPAMTTVRLRDVTEDDLPVFFEHQRDPAANHMAAFPAREREAFMTHWTANVLGNDEGNARTILSDDEVVGNIVSWEQDGEVLVGYWIGREQWGRGIGTRALALFLTEVEPRRPLHAHVVRHNIGSIRVLEKNGFVVVGQERIVEGDLEIDEVTMRLDAG